MTLTQPQSSQTIQYRLPILNRADRAAQCSPFQLTLFERMQIEGVSLKAIAGHTGVEQGFTQEPLGELQAESALMWLIQTGLLRREVDGQGLTDSFRLTPLGRQLVQRWQSQDQTWRSPSWGDRLRNSLTRWMRLPDWL